MENNGITNTNITDEPMDMSFKEPKKHNYILPIIMFILLIVICITIYFVFIKGKDNKASETTVESNKYLDYRILSNSLENFDLYFMKLENKKVNKVYSPLSIKYALEMLEEGATGGTKEQISNIIGTYHANKYENSLNASLVNALFVKENFKKNIKEEYINNIKDKYNAELIYDDFETVDKINSWVSERTLKLINNIVDDISDKDFILTNALAIDMEWVNPIHIKDSNFSETYYHEDYSNYLKAVCMSGLSKIKFKGIVSDIDASEFHTVVNKYNIVKTLGEENIRSTVGNGYDIWVNEKKNSGYDYWINYEYPTKEDFLNRYIDEISENYGKLSTSTDYSFYIDDNVKIFSKDLKEYDGRTLEYIGIMPTNIELDEYINDIKVIDINNIISKLKPLELASFEEGYVTEITGFIPLFKFEYKLDLINDLKTLGITNVFDSKKANLDNIAKKAFIGDVSHKSNIEFSNDGIKAAAVTMLGGNGGGNDMYDYLYEVPIKKIDLTFDKPYMFIIRDKNSGEVWFTGTVYNPLVDAGDFSIGCGR